MCISYKFSGDAIVVGLKYILWNYSSRLSVKCGSIDPATATSHHAVETVFSEGRGKCLAKSSENETKSPI